MHPPATRAHELSVGQQALWFLHQLAPDSSAYNVSVAVNLHFPVDVARMAAAVRTTVSGHRMLNCVFRSSGGEIRRLSGVLGAEPVLEVHELAMSDREVHRFALRLAQRPFRLDRNLPIRVALLRRPGRPDILLMAAHHITMDDISQTLIMQQILAGYAGGPARADRVVTDTGADFDDFVRRQRRYLGTPRADAARTYWHRELAGAADAGDLPTDLARPAVYRFAGSEIDLELPVDVMAGVRKAAAARNATVFSYLFTAFQVLLYRFSAQTDLLVGYPVTLRQGRRFRDSIGYFVNTLPCHVRVGPADSFDSLLHRTGRKVLAGLVHRDYPFALMARQVEARREPDRAGLISAMFAMMSDGQEPGGRVERFGLDVSEYDLPQQRGQFDVTLQVVRHAAGAQLKYNTSLFTAETARNLADGYVDLLRSVTAGTLPLRLRDLAGKGA
jgi:hypothetical protein